MRITGDTIQIVTDAGETIAVNRRVLTHVESQAYKALLRPVKFRSLMPVGSFGVPEWVQSIEYDTIKGQAKWQPVEWAGQTDDLSVAEVQVGSASMRLFAMRSAYKYEDRELLRAQKLGMPLDSLRAEMVMTKAQTVLEEIAFKGTAGLTDHAVPVADSLIYGLANLPGVTPDTSLAASTTTSWTDLIATAIADGGADAFNEVIQIILADMLEIETSVETATKQGVVPDTLLMPLSLRRRLRQLMHPYTGKSAEAILLDGLQFINRFDYWHKLETAGGSSKRRLIAYPRTDERAVRCMIVKEPTPGTPFKREFDTKVGVELVCGGVQTKLPEAVRYYDMPADAG